MINKGSRRLDIEVTYEEELYKDLDRAYTQQKLLIKIFEASPDGARSPTLRELTRAVGTSTDSNTSRALDELEGKDYISRDRSGSRTAAQARGIWLTKRALAWLRRQGLDTSHYIRGAIASHEVCVAPLLGEVAAGNPISPEAYIPDEDVDEYVPLPARHLPIGKVFMLRVKGDSMIGDGILDGDQVIVVPYQGKLKADGEVVVALIDKDATVKRLYKQGETYRLESSNPQYESRLIREQDEFYVQGRVVGLFRIRRDGL
jgi:repressor LexA